MKLEIEYMILEQRDEIYKQHHLEKFRNVLSELPKSSNPIDDWYRLWCDDVPFVVSQSSAIKNSLGNESRQIVVCSKIIWDQCGNFEKRECVGLECR